jgi:pimeloyl-ACP methyl ester carboxylesterase
MGHIAVRTLVIFLLIALVDPVQAAELWKRLPQPLTPPKANNTGLVPVKGSKIYFAVHGAGPALVLLHGGLGNADHWGGQIRAFAKYYKVIAIDARGHGRSYPARQAYSYALMADDVRAILKHLAIEKAALVGWSDGGNAALSFAVRYPQAVTKLFVFGANFAPSGVKSPPKGSRTFGLYRKRTRVDYLALAPKPGNYRRFVKRLSRMWASQPKFTVAQLGAINAPVAVSVGQYDEIIRPAHSRRLAKLIPGAKLIVLPGLSHFAPWQDPAAFNKAVFSFLLAGPKAKRLKPEPAPAGPLRLIPEPKTGPAPK